MHVNLVLFGFVTPGLLASAFYFVPRLLRTELYSEKLGVITVILWNIALVAVVVTLAAGLTQGREYAELIWPIDVGVVLVFGLVFFNFIMTVKNRKEKILYVYGMCWLQPFSPHAPTAWEMLSGNPIPVL
jgi:cytochrome c oxidase cbb3-type subunit 1